MGAQGVADAYRLHGLEISFKNIELKLVRFVLIEFFLRYFLQTVISPFKSYTTLRAQVPSILPEKAGSPSSSRFF